MLLSPTLLSLIHSSVKRKHIGHFEQAASRMKIMFESVGEGATHGLEHGLKVCLNAAHAISQDFSHLNHHDKAIVLMAALLHDVGDKKIFKNNTRPYQQAIEIMEDIKFPWPHETLIQISLVSYSANGINKNYGPISFPDHYFIARDADRNEALGAIGLARIYAYGMQVERPIYCNDTPRPRNAEELYMMSSISCAKGKNMPNTTMDYMIGHLIPRRVMSSGSKYLCHMANQRFEIIKQVCLFFGDRGAIDLNDFVRFTEGDMEATYILHGGIV